MTEPVFFSPSRRFVASEIAALTGARLAGPDQANIEIARIAPAAEGGEGALIFVNGKREASALKTVTAAALLCPEGVAAFAPAGMAVLITPRPQAAFLTVARLLFPTSARPGPMTGEAAVSARAFVAEDADIEPGAIIEAGAVVGSGAAIGRGSVIAPNAVIGPSCRIGRDCYIGPNTTVQCCLMGDRVIIHAGVRIGQDGFGYMLEKGGHVKIPQIGRVVVQDEVEIGANTTIDRGTMSDTVIGEGTKIDNLIQIAHNVRIGRACVLAGQCGLSGSVTIGDHAMLGGAVGVADHVSIGAGAQIAARSGVTSDVSDNAVVSGYPAAPVNQWRREVATVRMLARKRRKGGKDG